jgi:hypothetical protein
MELKKRYFKNKNLNSIIFCFTDLVSSLKSCLLNNKMFFTIFKFHKKKGFFQVLNYLLHNYNSFSNIEKYFKSLPSILRNLTSKFKNFESDHLVFYLSIHSQIIFENLRHSKEILIEKDYCEIFIKVYEYFSENVKKNIKISLLSSEINHFSLFFQKNPNIYSLRLNLDNLSLTNSFKIEELNLTNIQVFQISPFNNKDNSVLRLLEVNNLREIELKLDVFLNPYKTLLEANCKSLRNLFLSCGNLDQNINLFIDSISLCKSLIKISLFYTSLTALNELKLIQKCLTLSNLEKVLISLISEDNKKYFLLNSSQNLRKLKKIRIGQTVDDNYLSFLNTQISISSVILNFSKNTTDNWELFSNIMLKKRIKKVEIFFNFDFDYTVNYEFLVKYLSFLVKNKSIEKIIFNSNNQKIDLDEFYTFLLNLLEINNNITHLSIYGNKPYYFEFGNDQNMMKIEEKVYFDEKILNLIDILIRRQKNITKLVFNCHCLENITDNFSRKFTEIIVNYNNYSRINSHITKITLYLSNLDEMKEFPIFLSLCDNLKYLDLSFVVMPHDKTLFYESLIKLKRLEGLRLSFCDLQENEIISTLESLNSSFLKYLDLDSNHFSDGVFEYLNVNKEKFDNIIEMKLTSSYMIQNIDKFKINVLNFIENSKYLNSFYFRPYQPLIQEFIIYLIVKYPYVVFNYSS